MTFVAGATNPQERILQAAAELFAQVGFSGASTRDIAKAAAVNDATVYRHFSSKKVLFAAVLEAELQKLRVRPDFLARIANAAEIRSALQIVFELLTDALAGQPRLLRLLQFSALEFGSSLQPLYNKYLGDLLDGAAAHLGPRLERATSLRGDPRDMVVAFAATVVGLQTLYPLFGRGPVASSASRESAAVCAELWQAMLFGCHGPVARLSTEPCPPETQ